MGETIKKSLPTRKKNLTLGGHLKVDNDQKCEFKLLKAYLDKNSLSTKYLASWDGEESWTSDKNRVPAYFVFL